MEGSKAKEADANAEKINKKHMNELVKLGYENVFLMGAKIKRKANEITRF